MRGNGRAFNQPSTGARPEVAEMGFPLGAKSQSGVESPTGKVELARLQA